MAELFITGEIDEFTETQFINQIKSLPPKEPVNININSPGGSVFAGYSIYNNIKALPNPTTTTITGIGASIASVIALAGDEVRISELGQLMIHNPFVDGTKGNQNDLRNQADELEKLAFNIREVYASKTGISEATLQKLMNQETLFNSVDALELGFVDSIVNPIKAAALINNKNDMDIISKIRENAQALGVTSKVKAAEEEAVQAIVEAAEEAATEKRNKALENAEGTDILTVDMVNKAEFEEFKELVTSFINTVVEKFDGDLTNEQIEESLDVKVENSLKNILSKFKSNANLPKDVNVADKVSIKATREPNLTGFNNALQKIKNNASKLYN